ncbi:hypothetical protein LTR74_007912 [Friedmanniomyces endolithicus]|nr:hypothetical protein LTR74_007912 [Friedmanniomyces endolithicus]
MDKAHAATVAAQAAVVLAQELLSKTLSKEMQLHRQLDYNSRCAGEAIAVEEQSIEEQEAEEFMAELDLPSFDPLPWDDRLMLSPSA